MRKIVIIVSILLLGLGILLYPVLSNYLVEKNGTHAIEAYQNMVSDLDQSEIDAALRAAKTYNENLTGQPVHDPFLDGSGMAMPKDYWQVLNLGNDNIMGFLEIPKIDVNLPIYHGTSSAVLDRGVGHLEGSTLPIGGSACHCVLTGHSGLPNARLFTDLTELKIGDLFYINVLGETLSYQVDQIRVILPYDTDALRRVPDNDYCTLLTCTPYGVNDHRLLVRGVRVPYNPNVKADIIPVATSHANNLVLVAGIVTAQIISVIILVIVTVRWRRSHRRVPRQAEVTDG
ncbi:MAG: class C sortase [Actinomycetia bacterium]|nr:class C sortase [Actinomycetes bacterium]